MTVSALTAHRLVGLAVIAAIVILLPAFFPSTYYTRVATLVFIFALAVVGLNLLMGFAGQVSLGHAGFVGIGGYSVAIGATHLGIPAWLCIFVGAALSGLIAFLVGALLALNLNDSPTGRALRAIHDSEVAAAVLGIDVSHQKLAIFAVSAIYASVSGSYLALFNGHITPDVSGFLSSIELVAMVVLGGMGSVTGSLIGAAVLVVLPQTLTALHEYEHMVLGLILMGFMIFLRRGIMPGLATAIAGRRL